MQPIGADKGATKTRSGARKPLPPLRPTAIFSTVEIKGRPGLLERRFMRQVLPFRLRVTAAAIVGVLPAMSGIIPVLDIYPEDFRDGIEEHHHEGTHGLPHDHFICIQQETNQLAADADIPSAPSARLATADDQISLPAFPTALREVLSPRPRSPPLA